MSSIEKMTFCLMEAIGRTLLRFPWLIWIEVKPFYVLSQSCFKRIAHIFLANSSVEMASFRSASPNLQYARGVHLIQWVLVLFFSFPLFPSIWVKIGFCFEISRVSFLFFLGVITEKLCFFKILNIVLFHDSLVCNDTSARTFMVGFFKKNTFCETEINEILISHLNRFHSTWARIHLSFWIFFKLFSWHWGRQQN